MAVVKWCLSWLSSYLKILRLSVQFLPILEHVVSNTCDSEIKVQTLLFTE